MGWSNGFYVSLSMIFLHPPYIIQACQIVITVYHMLGSVSQSFQPHAMVHIFSLVHYQWYTYLNWFILKCNILRYITLAAGEYTNTNNNLVQIDM